MPAIVWALFILVGCLISPKFIPHPSWNFIGLDKLIHFTLFFVQCGTLAFIFHRKGMQAYRNAGLSFVISVLYGILVEFLQMMMRAGRQADVDDAIANTIGAALFSLLLVAGYRFLRR
ncbi:MAG: VanZ family protein [Flavobacteriales bacterium]